MSKRQALAAILAVRLVPLDEAVRWERNPKLHNLPKLRALIRRYGFRDAPIFDATLGAIVAGNGRISALLAMRADGEEPPRGIVAEGERWMVPVQFGVDAASRAEAEAFGIDHNSATAGYAGQDPAEMLRIYDDAALASILEDVEPVAFEEIDIGALLAEAEWAPTGSSIKSAALTSTKGQATEYVRPVIRVDDIAAVEAALQKTGLANRGDALVAVCRAFLEPLA